MYIKMPITSCYCTIDCTIDLLIAMDITSGVDGLYWGVLVSTMLSGITVTQGWTYAHNNNDKWYLRLLVAVLMWVKYTYY
ncbi:hypothetical protein L208DRAFT_852826 [Tricholoma matsutake]|nr:hypothetical protein L208DRAFT_852826 [Tricholoma matsutake 945]